MKIYLHVGPHKTGTTSVQQWMLDNSKQHLRSHGLYYPDTPEFGPGHTLLAWDTLGIHDREIDSGLLHRVVEAGARNGAESIFLSSEEFCMGLTKGTLENLAVLNELGTVELIVTLSSLKDRFLAEVATLILYRGHFDLSSLDLNEFCLSRPGLRPNILHELRQAICPSKVHVILGEKTQPALLFQAVAQILNVREPKHVTRINKRQSDTHTRLLNFLNTELPGFELEQNQVLASRFEKLLQKKGVSDRMKPIVLEESKQNLLNEMWALQCQLYSALHRIGDITLYSSAE